MNTERGYKAGMLEGGEGYNPHTEYHTMDYYRALESKRLVALGFADAATTQARREAWNTMVKSGQITAANRKQIETRLGYTLMDIAAAKTLYGIK